MTSFSGLVLASLCLLGCVSMGTPRSVHMEAFVKAPCAARRVAGFSGSGVCERKAPQHKLGGSRRTVAGTRMMMHPQGLVLPDLFGRMRLRDGGDVDEQRQELNRLHVERDNLLERIKMKMRAASYNFGGQDWCRLFAHYDSDNNGMIDFKEFESLCRHMGLQPTQMSVEEMWIVFEEVDTERRGNIEVGEFTQWLSGKLPNYAQQEASRRQRGLNPNQLVDDPWAYSYGPTTGLNMPVPPERHPHTLEDEEASSLSMSMSMSMSVESSTTRPTAWQERGAAGVVADKAQGTLEALLEEIAPFLRSVSVAHAHVTERERDVVYYLLNELGLGRNKVLGLAITSPSIFSLDLDRVIRRQVDYLREIGVPANKVGKIVVSFPQILELSQERKEATVRYLEQLGMPLHSIGKCLSQHPTLLSFSVETKLVPTVEFLMKECRIPHEKIGNLISTFPTILAYSVESTLAPRLAFIRDELNVPKHKLAALLLKFPQLLGLAIEANVQPTIGYLTKEIGIPEEDISKIVQQHPQILGLSVEANLKPKVRFLLDEIGVPRDKLARIVSSFPTLLSLSIDTNLRPKLQYLLNEGGCSREDILKAPHLLAYSLKQRIQPRIEFIRSNNIPMALHSILCLSNSAFIKRFDQFEDFKPSEA